MYAARRERFLSRIGAGVAVFPAAPVVLRNQDTEYDYRQDSDFYYLTGFDEPESVLVLTNRHKDHRFVLFVRPRDPAREVWDGARAGVEGAVEQYGADAAYPIAELATRLPEYLNGVERLHYRLGRNRVFDTQIIDVIESLRGRSRAGATAPTEIADPATTLHEMRLLKSADEIGSMEKAIAITKEAHLGAMRKAKPGRFEYELEAELIRTFRELGSERVAYGSIVGSGPNATILHHRKNNRRIEEGDLVLIDAGAEYEYYASDVTRTFPASGHFTDEQRRIYEVVWEAQAASIEAVRPGVTLEDIHDVAVKHIAGGLIRLGLLDGPVERAIESGDYKKYYMHRTSHWLGMDVHDVGAYRVRGAPRVLEPGFVFTIEPGVYIAMDAKADSKWRGIGVRIEDDMLVTAGGYRNLTKEIPNRAEDMERLVRS